MVILFTSQPLWLQLEEQNSLGEMQLCRGEHIICQNTHLVPARCKVPDPYVNWETWFLPLGNLHFSPGGQDIYM